jgi:putative ABC transport system ATP-binding protein
VLDRVNREIGAATVLITHNAAIGAMADRVVTIGDGLIQRIDVNQRRAKPEEISW